MYLLCARDELAKHRAQRETPGRLHPSPAAGPDRALSKSSGIDDGAQDNSGGTIRTAALDDGAGKLVSGDPALRQIAQGRKGHYSSAGTSTPRSEQSGRGRARLLARTTNADCAMIPPWPVDAGTRRPRPAGHSPGPSEP